MVTVLAFALASATGASAVTADPLAATLKSLSFYSQGRCCTTLLDLASAPPRRC